MLDLDEDLVVDDLGIVDDPVEGGDRRAPDVMGEKVVEPLARRSCASRLFEPALDVIATVDDVGGVDAGEVIDAEQSGEAAKRLHRQRQPAIRRRVDAERRTGVRTGEAAVRAWRE